MDAIAKFIEDLQAAEGDVQAQAALTAELLVRTRPEPERARLSNLIDAAAVLRWFDARLLAAVAGIPEEEARLCIDELKALPFVEPFGVAAQKRYNVHEVTRLGWRRGLARESPERLRVLSARAAERFATDASTAGRIDWLYHLLYDNPARGAAELEALDRDWAARARPEDRHALAAGLRDLVETNVVPGKARVEAILCRAEVGNGRGEPSQLEAPGPGALQLPQDSAPPTGESRANRQHGSVLQEQGKLAEDKRKATPPRKPPRSASRRSRATQTPAWAHVFNYALLALAAFVCGLVILGVMLWKADILLRLGLTGRAYYVALLPLGLSVAAFLFGAMRSYATFKGQRFGGVLDLGGPIVGFVLTVVGGFVLVPEHSTFPLTVFVHGEAGIGELVLRNSGRVLLDLGVDRRSGAIGQHGEAYFPAVPTAFRGQEVSVSVDAQGFEIVKPSGRLQLGGPSLYLAVRRTATQINGRVQDESGAPLAGVQLSIEDLRATSNELGHFSFTIPGSRWKPDYSLEATAPGFKPSRTTVVSGSNDPNIILRRQP